MRSLLYPLGSPGEPSRHCLLAEARGRSSPWPSPIPVSPLSTPYTPPLPPPALPLVFVPPPPPSYPVTKEAILEGVVGAQTVYWVTLSAFPAVTPYGRALPLSSRSVKGTPCRFALLCGGRSSRPPEVRPGTDQTLPQLSHGSSYSDKP